MYGLAGWTVGRAVGGGVEESVALSSIVHERRHVLNPRVGVKKRLPTPFLAYRASAGQK
jgi:hypothetical protein